MNKIMALKSSEVRGLALLIIAGLITASFFAPGSVYAAPNSKDCSVTSIGLTPLNDMTAAQDYQGESGGLYGDGLNVLPPGHPHWSHTNVASELVLPRDTGGAPDLQNGKIGLISIGMSNTKIEFDIFMEIAELEKSPQVVLVNGAQPGMAASDWAFPSLIEDPWIYLEDAVLDAGLAVPQVQVVWLKQANKKPEPGLDDFPVYAERLRNHMGVIAKKVKERYPNVQLIYISSRIYAGYGQTNPLNPEPFAYESAFSVRWLIEDQMNGGGLTGVTYANSPVLVWGPYLWADGTVPRSDGLVWLCEDLLLDGIHPSESGKDKVAGMLLDFFTNDPLASRWFGEMQLFFLPLMQRQITQN
jgi:hypothetical protein